MSEFNTSTQSLGEPALRPLSIEGGFNAKLTETIIRQMQARVIGSVSEPSLQNNKWENRFEENTSTFLGSLGKLNSSIIMARLTALSILDEAEKRRLKFYEEESKREILWED